MHASARHHKRKHTLLLALRQETGMHLYNLTLQPPAAINQAIVGNFSGTRQQEIIVSHGTRLELLRPDPHTGKVTTVIATDVFGSIRSLAAFRLTGGTKGER
jgi:splicing factor 3B subunit 3